MNIANLIQGEAELFAEQDIKSHELDPNEWNHVDMSFQWEGLNVELNASVYVREPAFHGSYDQPSEDYEYEFGDVTVTHIEIDHSLLNTKK